DGDLRHEDRVQQQARQTVARTLKQLPPEWQGLAEKAATSELVRWTAGRGGLEKRGTGDKGKERAQARLKLGDPRQGVGDLEAQQASFPEEVRQGPERVGALLAAARRADRQREEELSQAKQHRALLDSLLRQREQIQKDYLEAEGVLAQKRLLAELLGK